VRYSPERKEYWWESKKNQFGFHALIGYVLDIGNPSGFFEFKYNRVF